MTAFKEKMKSLGGEYKKCLSSKSFLLSFFIALVLLSVSLLANYAAGTYATRYESNPVTDIILSNTRVYDLDGIFIYGTGIFFTIIGLLGFSKPQRWPFILKSIALFTLIRSAFIVLTHIAPYPTHIIIDPASYITYFTFGGDLFFSGHTGLPFLMALLFWEHKYMRIFFIAYSFFFAVVVLLSHLHYSIDVLAAFFITYSIFHIAEFFFKKDRELFLKG